MAVACGFLDPVPESSFWIHSLHALDALAALLIPTLDPHSHLHPNSVCHEGHQRCHPIRPQAALRPGTSRINYCHCHCYRNPLPDPSSATLPVSDISLCSLASCGLDPAATKHLIYDCFSKRRHSDLPGPSSASGNQALADSAALYTPLANPHRSPRHLHHQRTNSPSFAPRHVYFRSSIPQGYHHFQQL